MIPVLHQPVPGVVNDKRYWCCLANAMASSPRTLQKSALKSFIPPLSIWLHYAWPGFPFRFAYCKRSKTGGTRLRLTQCVTSFPDPLEVLPLDDVQAVPIGELGMSEGVQEEEVLGGGGSEEMAGGGENEEGDTAPESQCMCVWFFQWWLDSYHIVVHTLCNVLCSQTLSLLVEEVTGW